jgi:hypothetical protein
LVVQVPEVQLLEPALCLFDAGQFKDLCEATYAALSKPVAINLVTFYDDVGACFEWVCNLPVKAISLDFCGVVRCLLLCCLYIACCMRSDSELDLFLAHLYADSN